MLGSAFMVLQLAACSPRQLVVGQVADELASQPLGDESDLLLVRDAAPYHLKLSEAVLAKSPAHRKLAESVASGFTQYAYAFVAFEADRIEATSAREAEAMRQRAAKLYRRANRHAMTALELNDPGFAARLGSADARDWPSIRPDEVGLAYWAAASWAAWISLSKDKPDVVADLPLAIRLATLAWQADPNWSDGATTGLMAMLESSRPGGNRDKALAYFDRAIDLSGERSLSPWVAKAEGHALPAGDRDLFVALLNRALAIPEAEGSPLALQNEVMRRRASWLLANLEDLF